MPNTVFGMDIRKYNWLLKFGTAKQKEALEKIEMDWAIAREYQEMSKSDRILYESTKNTNWANDPQ